MSNNTTNVTVHSKYPLLIHCDDCGEYKGIIYSKENSPELHKRASDKNEPMIITCLCDGIPCPKCGRIKHRPISNYYDEEKDAMIHVAYFTGNMKCNKCK